MKSKKNHQLAVQVSFVSIIVNFALSIIKLIVGILAFSGALVSDAIHSASDVFSTFIVLIGVKVSEKESDSDHQYGHERLECVASMILASILLLTGFGIGYKGLNNIIEGEYNILQIPGLFALAVAVLSIVVKEWMYWYTRAAAKKINSGSLMADAWHHRSDALSSVGSFVGILGARLGYPVLDSVASVLICAFIIKAAYDIFKDSIEKMVDKSCSHDLVCKMEEITLRQNGVLGLDDLKTRMFGSKIYVDIEIKADGNQTLNETHEIAENVHDAIESEFEMVKHCMVHVNPSEYSNEEKAVDIYSAK